MPLRVFQHNHRESRHCIGSFLSCRKRAFARMDNPIITSAKMADTISTAMSFPLSYMFACEHAHLPTGLSPIFRSQSLNASAIASCKLMPCLRAVMCMANDISGLK